ncbi:ATP-binding protein [Streptomyces massasporeus]
MTEPPQTAEPTPPPGDPTPGAPAPGGPAPGDPAAAGLPPQTPAAVRRRATLAGTVVSVLLILAIVFGSRLLRDFDSALLPYAVATVFLAFGVAYRYTVWISAPGARRLFHKGWGSFFSVANFRTAPTALPKMIATYLGFQKFLGARSHARWAAHQLIFWGCLLAAAITFPLTWGWFTFTSSTRNDVTTPIRVVLTEEEKTFSIEVGDEVPGAGVAAADAAGVPGARAAAPAEEFDDADGEDEMGLAVIRGLVDDVEVSAGEDGGTIRMSWPVNSADILS